MQLRSKTSDAYSISVTSSAARSGSAMVRRALIQSAREPLDVRSWRMPLVVLDMYSSESGSRCEQICGGGHQRPPVASEMCPRTSPSTSSGISLNAASFPTLLRPLPLAGARLAFFVAGSGSASSAGWDRAGQCRPRTGGICSRWRHQEKTHPRQSRRPPASSRGPCPWPCSSTPLARRPARRRPSPWPPCTSSCCLSWHACREPSCQSSECSVGARGEEAKTPRVVATPMSRIT